MGSCGITSPAASIYIASYLYGKNNVIIAAGKAGEENGSVAVQNRAVVTFYNASLYEPRAKAPFLILSLCSIFTANCDFLRFSTPSRLSPPRAKLVKSDFRTLICPTAFFRRKFCDT
jgi:hypothetical protein